MSALFFCVVLGCLAPFVPPPIAPERCEVYVNPPARPPAWCGGGR